METMRGGIGQLRYAGGSMKRLMMLLMLWTGLITAVYIVETAKLWRDAPTGSVTVVDARKR
jgi:hypothetical protein